MKRPSGEGSGRDETDAKHSRRTGTNLSIRASDYQQLPFPNFARPLEVGSFSTDSTKEFVGDRSRLRYLSMPTENRQLDWDLNKGRAEWIQDKTKNFLSLICDWIIKGRSGQCGLKEAVRGVDFVCWRGCLTLVGGSPYEKRDGWKIAVLRVGGVFFLAQYDTDEKIASQAAMSERDKSMTYWGHKFESYLSADADGKLDTESPVNCMEQFCLVMRGKLGSHRILYSGEVDCQDPANGDYVELKTNREFGHARQEDNFHRFKTVKWWLQSFLIGIPRIIAGFRDDAGVVSHLKEWRLEELIRDKRRGWEGSVCLQFASSFFDMLKACITHDDPNQIWVVEREAGRWEMEPPRRLSGEENEAHSFLQHSFLHQFGF